MLDLRKIKSPSQDDKNKRKIDAINKMCGKILITEADLKTNEVNNIYGVFQDVRKADDKFDEISRLQLKRVEDSAEAAIFSFNNEVEELEKARRKEDREEKIDNKHIENLEKLKSIKKITEYAEMMETHIADKANMEKQIGDLQDQVNNNTSDIIQIVPTFTKLLSDYTNKLPKYFQKIQARFQVNKEERITDTIKNEFYSSLKNRIFNSAIFGMSAGIIVLMLPKIIEAIKGAQL